jgi:hypothetical protein
MFEGAIQKGDLAFAPEGSSHSPARNTAVQMERKNPRPATKLTGTGLKAFASKYDYDPELLRIKTVLRLSLTATSIGSHHQWSAPEAGPPRSISCLWPNTAARMASMIFAVPAPTASTIGGLMLSM